MPVYGGPAVPFRRSRGAADAQPRAKSAWRIRTRASEWHDIIAQAHRAATAAADQYVYWQVTRGAERGRNHAPLPDIPRTVFAFAAPFPDASAEALENGVACVTAQDTRWARCDIKSVSLLANVLLRQLAVDANASETILLRDGELMEASSSAVHVVINGEIRTPPNSRKILPGTTRGVDRRAGGARSASLTAPLRVTENELRSAEEIWLTAAVREMSAGDRARRQARRHRQTGPALPARARRARALQGASWRGRRGER